MKFFLISFVLRGRGKILEIVKSFLGVWGVEGVIELRTFKNMKGREGSKNQEKVVTSFMDAPLSK